MTSRERVLSALRRQPPDRVPATLYEQVIGYVPALEQRLRGQCGGQAPGEFFKCDVTSVKPASTRLRRTTLPAWAADPNIRVDEWGVGWRGGGQWHYEQILHPLERSGATEIRDYPFPDVTADYRYEGLQTRVAEAHARGLAVTAYPGSVFERAWYLRGMTELFADLAFDAATAEFLLDQIADRVLGAAQRLAATGIDLLVLGDDIATQQGLMMSLALWKRVFKPRLERIIRAAKEINPDLLIFYHSDGNVWGAIPELIDAGVEVLNPVQPECMDPAEVKRVFGDRLAVFGTISVQRTMPLGTPDEVRAEVRHRLRTVGHGGGLLLAPAHVLQPDTPWENIRAFFEAVEEFGYYSCSPSSS